MPSRLPNWVYTVFVSSALLLLAPSYSHAQMDANQERAADVVKGFIHCVETANAELCMNLLSTPYYHDSNRVITTMAELRGIIESSISGGEKNFGNVEYAVYGEASTAGELFGQAYVDILVTTGSDKILFRVRPGDVYKIVGLTAVR